MREAGTEHHAAGRRPVRGPGRGDAAVREPDALHAGLVRRGVPVGARVHGGDPGVVMESARAPAEQERSIAEAPWSAAEWAVALLFVKLVQAQPGRQAR